MSEHCKLCRGGWFAGQFGPDVECVNGVLIDIDEAHDGQSDVIYPVAPCHPCWSKQIDHPDGLTWENDSIERLEAWRLSMTKPMKPQPIDVEAIEAVARAICLTTGLSPDSLYEHHEWEDWPCDRRDEYIDFRGEKRTRLMHFGWRKWAKVATAALAAMAEFEAQSRANEKD